MEDWRQSRAFQACGELGEARFYSCRKQLQVSARSGILHIIGYVAESLSRLSHRTGDNGEPVIQHPTHILDTIEAIQYLQSKYLGRKLFLIGHSAGGHIIFSIALKPQFQVNNIDGFIGVEGIYDIPLLLDTFPDYSDFIEQAFGKDSSKYKEASVVGFKPVPVSSPITLLYSPDDELVDPGQHLSMEKFLKSENIPVTVSTELIDKHDECLITDKLTELVTEFVQQHI
ncbi:unnamed protein product [Umbelopsis sp. WA50703]|jgi:kynurenine formamidase